MRVLQDWTRGRILLYESESKRERAKACTQSSGELKGKGESQYGRDWAARLRGCSFQPSGSRVRTQWPTHGGKGTRTSRGRGVGVLCGGVVAVGRMVFSSLLLLLLLLSARPNASAVAHTEKGRGRRKTNAQKYKVTGGV